MRSSMFDLGQSALYGNGHKIKNILTTTFVSVHHELPAQQALLRALRGLFRE